MRRACRWLPQRQHYVQSCRGIGGYTLPRRASVPCLQVTHRSSYSTIPAHDFLRPRCPRNTQNHRRTQSRSFRSIAGETVSSSVREDGSSTRHPFHVRNEDKRSADGPEPTIPLLRRERKDIEAWLRLLDRYLPDDLRESHRNAPKSSHNWDIRSDVPKILNTARKPWNTGQDLLVHMMVKGRGKAALHIINTLLTQMHSHTSSSSHLSTPSNIDWPSASLARMCRKPIETILTRNETGPVRCEPQGPEQDLRYASHISGIANPTMECVWLTLGTAIMECADMPDTQAAQVLFDVQLILGLIHNLDLVPKNVYDYRLSPLNATVQRPPILHLVSSRVLTALSDAVWRNQQDEIIEQAARHGASYRDIGRDPPGGRFRLRVRPLPAEVWLEFVLWCCAEGGFASVGARLVEGLMQRRERPWFAVTWSPQSGAGQTSPSVHWDRVKTRHGGAVGLIEGYSREEPFVQVPPLTISTEVVLALVDANIDCVSRGDSQKGLRLGNVIEDVTNMVTFLEPHDLPVGYFDFLAVRLLQSDAISTSHDTSAMYNWYQKLVFMKSLQQSRPQQASRISYDLGSLASHSELFAGILHQSLETFVQAGDVHRALESFNSLQELIDQSKLQAIDAFLNERISPAATESAEEDDVTSGGLDRQDFVGSHGHLPLHKLAGLLDLTTDTTLVGFGQWLLYNSDPDGPLIPQRAYARPAMARVLLRFAISSGDRALASNVQTALNSGYLKPTVRVLRARVNTFVHLLEFDKARYDLRALRDSEGGGAGLNNFAYVAATILRLEHKAKSEVGQVGSGPVHQRSIQGCIKLLEDMLEGMYQNRGADFTQRVHTLFNQQTSALLRIFQFHPESLLAQTTSRYRIKFRASNSPNLVPAVFNILLEAVVETKGAMEGVRFWDKFCTVPDDTNLLEEDSPLTEADTNGDIIMTPKIEEDYQLPPNPTSNSDGAGTLTDETSFLPFINSDERTQLASQRHVSNVAEVLENSDANTSLSTMTAKDFEKAAGGFFPSPPTASDGSTDEREMEDGAVVIANVRSLQIIVRRAVQEWHLPRDERHEWFTDSSLDMLDWAARRFKALGAPPDLAYVEVRRPLDRSDIKQLQAQMEAPHVVSRMLSRTQKPTGRKSVRRSPVGRLFIGKENTRATRTHDEEQLP